MLVVLLLISSLDNTVLLTGMESSRQQLWDSYSCACEPDAEQAAMIEELDLLVRGEGLSRKSSGAGLRSSEQKEEVQEVETVTPASAAGGRGGDLSSYDGIHESLRTVETACNSFISNLDDILGVLEQVEQAHSDVTGRTNSLMVNCETLLEQQHTLQSVVDQLRDIITPFNDIEEVAGQLGIPVDATGRPYATTNSNQPGGSKALTSISSGMLTLFALSVCFANAVIF